MRQHQSSVDTRSTFSILYLLQGNVSSWFWKPMKQCISAKISTVYQFFRFCTKVFSFSLSFQSRTLRSWLEGNLVLASHGDQSWKWKLGILTTIPANSIRVGMYLLKSKIWRYHTAWISFRSSCAVSFPGYWPFWGLKSVKDGYSYLWHFIHRREIKASFFDSWKILETRESYQQIRVTSYQGNWTKDFVDYYVWKEITNILKLNNTLKLSFSC